MNINTPSSEACNEQSDVNGLQFDYKQLPPWLVEIIDVVKEESLAPIEIVYPAVIMAILLSIQRRIDVTPRPGLVLPIVQYFFVIADSGAGKTSATKLTMKPHAEYDARQVVLHNEARIKYAVEKEVHKELVRGWRARCRKSGSDQEVVKMLTEEMAKLQASQPEEPHLEQGIVNNVTPEAFLHLLRKRNTSLGIFTDEGGSLLKSKLIKSVAELNTLWSAGMAQPVNRKTMPDFTVADARVSVFVATQIEPIGRYLEEHGDIARSSGLLARCWISKSDYQPPKVLADTPAPASPKLAAFYERITQLRNRSSSQDAEKEPRRVLHLSPGANTKWVQKFNELQEKIQPQGPYHDIRDFVLKQMENVARHAAILHAYEHDDTDEISEHTLDQALLVGEWYLLQFKEQFGAKPVASQSETDAQLLLEWFYRFCTAEDTDVVDRSFVLKFGPKPLRDANRLHFALTYLIRKRLVFQQHYHYPGSTKSTRQIVVSSSQQHQSSRWARSLTSIAPQNRT